MLLRHRRAILLSGFKRALSVAALLLCLNLYTPPAFALQYDLCKSPNQSLSCAVAFEKLRTMKNPINNKNFFDDGVHIKGNKLLKLPNYHIAQPDLDKDGVPEIIVALSEDKKSKNLFCKTKFECPHFVIQNRNPNLKKPRLRHYQALNVINAYGIGLSTDEIIGGYQSLRVYKGTRSSQFNTYQYDKKTDQYHDLGTQKERQ